MTGPSWTPEDVELVVNKLTDPPELWEFCTVEQAAKAALAALAEAGRLLPADAKRSVHFRYRNVKGGYVRYTTGEVTDDGWVKEFSYEWVGPWLPVEPKENGDA